MSGTIFVEAFGRFLSGGYHPDEDLYSVFRARSVLMGWYTPPPRKPSSLSPVFWRMEEADICEQNDAPRIATAQVGLEDGVPIVIALPALLQCFDDSLRRFGAVELSGYQVTASGLEAMQESWVFHFTQMINYFFHLSDMTNYFQVSHRSTEATMIVYELGKGYGIQLASELEKFSNNTFRYQRTAHTPGRDAPSEMSPWNRIGPWNRVGMSEYLRLSLPEGPDAAGWAMAFALGAILTLMPGTTDARLSLTYVEPDDG